MAKIDNPRRRLSERFAADLLADFERHGKDAIEACRVEKPDAYLKVVASLLPKEVHVGPTDGMTMEQLNAEIMRLLGQGDAPPGPRGQDGETLQ